MKTLVGEICVLRALEASDLDFLYRLENDESVWEVSQTTTPYSKFVLRQYLESAHRDIYEVKQLRLVICSKRDERPVGFIDLFDFEPKHRRVGVGIIIFDSIERRKGFASEALQLVVKYAKTHLNVHQLYANIAEDNQKSISLFKSNHFELVGTKKDWLSVADGFKNELLFQHIIDSK